MNTQFAARITSLMLLGLAMTACQAPATDVQLASMQDGQTSLSNLESAFWGALTAHCGHTFSGTSSFPDDPQDNFYGKQLVATVETCMDKEIHIPFAVGENKSRTWIFTRNEKGLQLKHQHLHDDGTPDEISNYGGIAAFGESALVPTGNSTELSQIALSFPADDETKNMLPEASTNVWTITLLSDPEGNYSGLTYYLTRHDKPRFKASLNRVNP